MGQKEGKKTRESLPFNGVRQDDRNTELLYILSKESPAGSGKRVYLTAKEIRGDAAKTAALTELASTNGAGNYYPNGGADSDDPKFRDKWYPGMPGFRGGNLYYDRRDGKYKADASLRSQVLTDNWWEFTKDYPNVWDPNVTKITVDGVEYEIGTGGNIIRITKLEKGKPVGEEKDWVPPKPAPKQPPKDPPPSSAPRSDAGPTPAPRKPTTPPAKKDAPKDPPKPSPEAEKERKRREAEAEKERKRREEARTRGTPKDDDTSVGTGGPTPSGSPVVPKDIPRSDPAPGAAGSNTPTNLKKTPTEPSYDSIVKKIQTYVIACTPYIITRGKTKGHFDIHGTEDGSTAGSFGGKRIIKISPQVENGETQFLSIINRTSRAKFLRYIPPQVLSSLIPEISLYKCIFDVQENTINRSTPVYVCPIPFDYTAHPTGTDATDYDLTQNYKGTLDLANIVSFDYQFIGTNPAEAEILLSAKLKLKFQSIDALLSNRKIYSLMTGKRKTSRQFKFKYSDLLTQVKKTDKDYYRIKARVGFKKVGSGDRKNPDSRNYFSSLFQNTNYTTPGGRDNFIEKLEDAINNCYVSMYLQPIAHDLQFNENGTIDLTINFLGSAEAAIAGNESNVLMVSEVGLNAKKQIDLLREELLKQEEAAKTPVAAAKQRVDPAIEDAQKKAREALHAAIKSNTYIIHEDFLETLYKLGKIRSVNIDPKFFKGTSKTSELSVGENESQLLLNLETTPNFQYDTINSISSPLLKARIDDIRAKFKKMRDNPASDSDAFDDLTEIPAVINFIFLQDLIAYVLTVLKNNELSAEDIFIVLGNILIPAINLQVGKGAGLAEKLASDTETALRPNLFNGNTPDNLKFYKINLGNIPISLEYFNKWFFEKVVKPSREEWTLKNFLHDIIELIRVSMTTVFGTGNVPIAGSRTTLTALPVSREFAKALSGVGNMIDITDKRNDFQNLETTNLGPTDEGLASSTILFLHVPALRYDDINILNIDENFDKNIFTFTVGATTGLLKKISYKKMDIPGLQEMRMTQQGELASGILRMKYDATIEMFGPSFFKPGDIVIINPVFLTKEVSTSAASVRLANEIGLGGVYMVLKSNTDITRDGVRTTLETVFQSYGTAFASKVQKIRDIRLKTR